LIEATSGRFIPLGDNKFIALTAQLRRQLNAIASATTQGKFHPMAAPLIEEAVQGITVKTNKAWQQQIKKLEESFSLQPQLPATLQANLRDYQKDGYDWACRLAYWGGGACLADDMGLGKTIMALAVILSRAADGPALVLAPTSVCFNWQQEALRFAPTLSVKMFGAGAKKDRAEVLNNAQAFDLIVCSYGLLQTQGEQLAKVKWHTLVADEAQAIKNPQAKRTQQAMTLTADFKMITTGTPIENNLGELWSLFSFINPGLLGTQEHFNQRFANTIQSAEADSAKNEDERKATAASLRKLISPFMLRRLKSDVLTELPSRTEINLHVTLSTEEAALYEAIRQQALEKMVATDAKAGQKRIKILAEIMRLRRACCHPALVLENTDIAGSKLKVFDGLIDELTQGNHKALVFSQFIGHLAILRQHLDQKGISYQYLDGSTPAAKRQIAVNAFQSGEGDLFLISLKAGGAGLNLTAADYVIHMDPWWNPAVEDQASDRAHRMGQTRPVTIYRLITQNTIEDKIVALHQQKRDLANSLLEGTDSTGNLTFDDMMNLLRSE
jgi:SNF2 family DNA or RNA helicase